MKFSIIIPALNEEKMIGQALQAILTQTHQDYEIIVVDNNSTDNTASIVASYAQQHQKVRLIPCPLQGLLNARNAGLQAATGDIIAQLDADNVPHSYWLEHAHRHFVDNSHIAAAIGAYDYADAIQRLGVFQGIALRYVGFLSQSLFFTVGNYYVQKRKYGALMLGGNAFIKKEALQAVGGYNTSHTFYNEDLVTASAIATVGYVKFFFDLTVKTSARRHAEVGFWKLQKRYNVGTFDVLRGRTITNQEEEHYHPH